MSEEKQEEKEKQVIRVYPKDINKTQFLLEPGKEVVMILEEEEYDTSD